jgi:hypothetical protein
MGKGQAYPKSERWGAAAILAKAEIFEVILV